MPSTAPMAPVTIAPPPTTAQHPPLPSSSTATSNALMQSGTAVSYSQQYPPQPPLPPTGMYPGSGKVIWHCPMNG